MASYAYNQQGDLSCSELFFWIAVDKTLDQLGVGDVGAVIPTSGKFKGATKGTSVASLAGRHVLNHELKYRLPTITGSSLRTLRIAMTRNLGAFVGRTVPVVGWIILANDVVRITWNTVTTYNTIVRPEDRLAP
jgi:hypothetical protein